MCQPADGKQINALRSVKFASSTRALPLRPAMLRAKNLTATSKRPCQRVGGAPLLTRLCLSLFPPLSPLNFPSGRWRAGRQRPATTAGNIHRSSRFLWIRRIQLRQRDGSFVLGILDDYRLHRREGGPPRGSWGGRGRGCGWPKIRTNRIAQRPIMSTRLPQP